MNLAPTPWVASAGRREANTPMVAEVHDSNGDAVVSGFGLSATDRSIIAFIVKRVNEYEGLVAVVNRFCNCGITNGDGSLHEEFQAALNEAVAVLKLAKETP